MLNPTFPKSTYERVPSPYVLKGNLASASINGNIAIDTGDELRLQRIFGDELWIKLCRAGLSPTRLANSNILEVCAGTGVLTHHLLMRCRPKSLTVNDISPSEMKSSQKLLDKANLDVDINWALGDLHNLNFDMCFDVIIGNSFLHHFHDCPKVLARFADLLPKGGVFISLHEPSKMSTVVEGAKLLAYPIACFFPDMVNNIARSRYKGQPSSTDIWMFDEATLKKVVKKAGFSKARVIPWNLFRPIVTQMLDLHLGPSKPRLSPSEQLVLRGAIAFDSFLNRILPSRFFGSVCLICQK